MRCNKGTRRGRTIQCERPIVPIVLITSSFLFRFMRITPSAGAALSLLSLLLLLLLLLLLVSLLFLLTLFLSVLVSWPVRN